MPRKAKGARLVWRAESRKADGSLRNAAGWFIRDGSSFVGACGSTGDRERAERALAQWIAEKYQPARERGRDPNQIAIADVVNVYLKDVAPGHSAPAETASRLTTILAFFGEMTVGQINGRLCRDFVATQTSQAAARRKLEDLRSALNHYRREGYCTSVPAIVLPPKPKARERWLTRDEAARLIWAAWRMRQTWKGVESDRRTGRHIARFILVGLYTGTRSAAICAAATRPTPGHGFVDYDRGIFYRRAAGARETRKRQPPVKLPVRLLAHMRRWRHCEQQIKTKARGKSLNAGRRISEDFVIEWNGKAVGSIAKAFRSVRDQAGLGSDVTPHVLRHTAATWLMQAGTDPWAAAGFLGMTVDVLIDTYGHHHPDFQAEAAEKITSGRGGRKARENVLDLGARQMHNVALSPHAHPTETTEKSGNIKAAR